MDSWIQVGVLIRKALRARVLVSVCGSIHTCAHAHKYTASPWDPGCGGRDGEAVYPHVRWGMNTEGLHPTLTLRYPHSLPLRCWLGPLCPGGQNKGLRKFQVQQCSEGAILLSSEVPGKDSELEYVIWLTWTYPSPGKTTWVCSRCGSTLSHLFPQYTPTLLNIFWK